jgi:hypothetical protein
MLFGYGIVSISSSQFQPRGQIMLHKHEVDLIENCLISIERGGVELPDSIKAKLAVAKQTVSKFHERKVAVQTSAYATAIGTEPSHGLMDGIAADCEIHGSK